MSRKFILIALAFAAFISALSFLTFSPVDAAPPVSCPSKPLKPTLAYPSEAGTVAFRRVKLVWAQSDCAASYTVLVKQDSKQGRAVDGMAGLTLTEFKTKRLSPGHRYFWQVQACNAHGCTRSEKFLFVIIQEKR